MIAALRQAAVGNISNFRTEAHFHNDFLRVVVGQAVIGKAQGMGVSTGTDGALTRETDLHPPVKGYLRMQGNNGWMSRRGKASLRQ